MSSEKESKIVEGIEVVPVLDPEERRRTTTRLELWSFYTYYIGNNGIPGYYFGPTQFQNLLFLAGYDPSQPPYTRPCGADTPVCVLPYLGRVRDVNSIVLLTNGICFALQAVVLLLIGAWADYGQWRPNITIISTFFAVAVSFAWLGVAEPARWHAGVVLYVLGLTTYQCCLTFWAAAFPGLVRDLAEVQESAAQVASGKKTVQQHAAFESLQRNRVSNIAWTICSAGATIILAILIGVLVALRPDASTENNTKAYSVLIAISGGAWLLTALPWFFFEKRRSGLALPPGASIFTIGFKHIFVAFRECMRLKQTFLYLIFYFLMGDVFNTCLTVALTLQNDIIAHSTLQTTLLYLLGISTQVVGVYSFWIVQKRYNISTKTMLTFTAFGVLLMAVWGVIGIHTDKFGYKHVWEFWVWQAYTGVFVSPWFSYSQTMISEVSPLPQMFLFFALFSVIGKTSAFIGPLVSSAIITASGNNNNYPFVFLFALGSLSMVFLYFVDVEKSRKECEEFVLAEAKQEVFVSDAMM